MRLFLIYFLAEGLGIAFGYLDKFHAPLPYPTLPIFSKLGTLDNLDDMEFASLSKPSSNLCLIVCNLEASHYKFTLFTFSAFKLFNVWLTLVYFFLFFVGVHESLWGILLVIKVLPKKGMEEYMTLRGIKGEESPMQDCWIHVLFTSKLFSV